MTPLSKEILQSEGWNYSFNYGGETPTKIEFTKGDVWKDSGRGAFLTFLPNSNEIKITTTDIGFNQDGPNHSVKMNVICKDL